MTAYCSVPSQEESKQDAEQGQDAKATQQAADALSHLNDAPTQE